MDAGFSRSFGSQELPRLEARHSHEILDSPLRPKDEDYWKEFKATPKAFIPLAEGEKLWGNRFGKHTSVRITAPGVSEADLRKDLAGRLHLSDIGLVPRNLKSEAAASAQGSVDFGGLFVGRA